jgi:hypothetical protein
MIQILMAILCACSSAVGPYAPAVRGPQIPGPIPPPPVEVGLHGLPFAPEWMNGCDEMNFYRVQFGLPEKFARLGWRESNCRNEDGVRTSCCHGYWQIHQMHPPQAAYDVCEVDSYRDINSDVPLEKQKQACVTFVLNRLQPGAWNL